LYEDNSTFMMINFKPFQVINKTLELATTVEINSKLRINIRGE